jgi:hypothetical protein
VVSHHSYHQAQSYTIALKDYPKRVLLRHGLLGVHYSHDEIVILTNWPAKPTGKHGESLPLILE